MAAAFQQGRVQILAEAMNLRLGNAMPQSTHSPRLFAAIVLAWAVFATANAQQPSAEVDGVSREVLKRESWLADSQKCPAALFPKKEDRDHLNGNDCKPGKLGSCLARCSASDASACYWLGHELEQARGLPGAYESLYQRSCRLGVVSGCTNRAAGMLEDRPNDSQLQACAAATFAKSCSFDDPWGCTMYAFHLSRGIGVAQDKKLALKMLEKSCIYGAEDTACTTGLQLRDAIQGKREAGKGEK